MAGAPRGRPYGCRWRDSHNGPQPRATRPQAPSRSAAGELAEFVGQFVQEGDDLGVVDVGVEGFHHVGEEDVQALHIDVVVILQVVMAHDGRGQGVVDGEVEVVEVEDFIFEAA